MKTTSPAVHVESSSAALAPEHPCDNRFPDCEVAPGEFHQTGSDIEHCPVCGAQRWFCDCDDEGEVFPWTGSWPGKAECREFGWYAKMVPGQGWVSCSVNEPGAFPDLDRLNIEMVWDRELGRFVRRKPDTTNTEQ